MSKRYPFNCFWQIDSGHLDKLNDRIVCILSIYFNTYCYIFPTFKSLEIVNRLFFNKKRNKGYKIIFLASARLLLLIFCNHNQIIIGFEGKTFVFRRIEDDTKILFRHFGSISNAYTNTNFCSFACCS